MRIECPNYLMKEKTKESEDKGLVATWNDTKNDSSDKYVVILWLLLPQPIR